MHKFSKCLDKLIRFNEWLTVILNVQNSRVQVIDLLAKRNDFIQGMTSICQNYNFIKNIIFFIIKTKMICYDWYVIKVI